jgi:O-antigen ligase
MFHAPPVTANFVWQHAHSTYLTSWAEAGVVFGSLPMVAGALAMAALWRKAHAPLPGRSMALAGLGALLLVAIHSLVDFSLEIQANMFMLLALVALGLGNDHRLKGRK